MTTQTRGFIRNGAFWFPLGLGYPLTLQLPTIEATRAALYAMYHDAGETVVLITHRPKRRPIFPPSPTLPAP